MQEDQQSRGIYNVVINSDEQSSIWPEQKGIPAGWKTTRKSGPGSEYLEYYTGLKPLKKP